MHHFYSQFLFSLLKIDFKSADIVKKKKVPKDQFLHLAQIFSHHTVNQCLCHV